jgi:hypothetical protein
MRCTTDLCKIRDAVRHRVVRLSGVLPKASTNLDGSDLRAVAFVAVELDNLIVSGLRCYTKSSLLRARASSGSRVTAAVKPTSPLDAARYVAGALRGNQNGAPYAGIKSPKDEQNVRDPKEIERVFITFSVSIIREFSLGLALNSSVFNDLKHFRHFFSHRSAHTFAEVKNFARREGYPSVACPEEIMLLRRHGSGVRIIDEWLSDVRWFFELAV